MTILTSNNIPGIDTIVKKPTFLLNVFGVGVSCRNLYSFVVYLYVNGSGSITSVGEESRVGKMPAFMSKVHATGIYWHFPE